MAGSSFAVASALGLAAFHAVSSGVPAGSAHGREASLARSLQSGQDCIPYPGGTGVLKDGDFHDALNPGTGGKPLLRGSNVREKLDD